MYHVLCYTSLEMLGGVSVLILLASLFLESFFIACIRKLPHGDHFPLSVYMPVFA